MTQTINIELHLSEAMVAAAKQYAVNIPKIACDAVIDELKKKIEVYSDVAEMSHSEKNRILRGTLQDKNRELLRMQADNVQLLDDLRRLTRRNPGTINSDARVSVWRKAQVPTIDATGSSNTEVPKIRLSSPAIKIFQ